ncbi:hypothetical protein [Amycolatopsis sp. 195334CR]|uniref:hypothetical protein n=1 Tax=Amycolatopsis sp. 195334CR TaxID=2814588 RepID=UPI001A8F6B3E|nr:hypothetical protein [Amycolatopsis sp. 195334CR]MBN6036183.1 hypothetical protein [Amycolatopsis sp. 195334CR]
MTTPDQSPQYTPPTSGDGGGSWFDHIADWAKAADSAASAPAGGYAFEPAELITIAREWDDLAAAYKRDKMQAWTLAQAQGPGAEYASGDHAQLVRQSGETLLSALDDRIEYCLSQAEKFRTAAGSYAQADTEAGAEISNQGGTL